MPRMSWINRNYRIVLSLFLWLVLLCGNSFGLEIAYHISMPNPADHYFIVQIDISDIEADSIALQMPAWSPGHYKIFDFARNISRFSAESNGDILPSNKTDKQTWIIQTLGASKVSVKYRVYSNNLTGELSHLNDYHAFLIGASLYMYVVDHEDNPVSLDIQPYPGWHILSSAGEIGQTHFEFPHYDRMIDELVQLGEFIVDRFNIANTEYRVCIANTGNRDGRLKLVETLRVLQQYAVEMLGPIDNDIYTFFWHFFPDSNYSAAMEHMNCCQMTRKHALNDETPNMDMTIWVAAHELSHTWNVKRLRPQGLGPFDYTKEVYTELLWFAEGCTSYLADLIMVRSGVWSKEKFYDQFADQMTNFHNSPGIYERSPEQAGFDNWLIPNNDKYQTDWYSNWTSYYISGELLGMCIDLEIRRLTSNQKNFDDFFLLLYKRMYQQTEAESYYAPGRGYTTSDLLQALRDTTNTSWDSFYTDYIASSGEMPFAQFLAYAGLELVDIRNAVSVNAYQSITPDYLHNQKKFFINGDMLSSVDIQNEIVIYKIIESDDATPLALEIREDWLQPEHSTSLEWMHY
jgi:predicted metalloprotease with PDZ domain